MLAASDSGGVFLSTDESHTWSHLDGLRPSRMSDVKFARDGSRRMLATAWGGSGAKDNISGIWLSTDGGSTWGKPSKADPPSCPRSNAWGIASAGKSHFFVGTDCGIAISTDGGATWSHKDVAGSTTIYSVDAQVSGGKDIVDACGPAGHFRSGDGGVTWSTTSTLPITDPDTDFSSQPLQACAGIDASVHKIAAVPGQPDVLLAALQFLSTRKNSQGKEEGWYTKIFESDNGGASWQSVSPEFSLGGAGRYPWVRIHQTPSGATKQFDVYVGSGLHPYRQTCDGSRSGPKCKRTRDDWLQLGVQDAPHNDQNDLAFSPVTGCALLMASDGGVHVSQGCGLHWPTTRTSAQGFAALQIYEVIGEGHPDHTDLYIATQDNFIWASANNGATWPYNVCGEGYALQVAPFSRDETNDYVTYGCPGYDDGISGAHFQNPQTWQGPPGLITATNPILIGGSIYVQFAGAADKAGQVNDVDLYVTLDRGQHWAVAAQVNLAFIRIANYPKLGGTASDPTIYAPYTRSDQTMGILRIDHFLNLLQGSAHVDYNAGPAKLGGFCHGGGYRCATYAFGVGHRAATSSVPAHDELIAADLTHSQMVVSHDGGRTWTPDKKLTTQVTANGNLRFVNENATLGTQVHTIAFDPQNADTIVIGTEAAGVIVSQDGGAHWRTVPGSEQVPAISSFYFDSQNNWVLVASFGRGLWRLFLDALDQAPPPLTPTPTPVPQQPTAGPSPTPAPPAQLVVSPTGVVYVECGPISYPPVTVHNSGGQTLTWHVTTTNAQVTVNPAGGSLGAGQTQTLTVTNSGINARVDLNFTSNGGSATISFFCRPHG